MADQNSHEAEARVNLSEREGQERVVLFLEELHEKFETMKWKIVFFEYCMEGMAQRVESGVSADEDFFYGMALVFNDFGKSIEADKDSVYSFVASLA
jgi:hypothetical protein